MKLKRILALILALVMAFSVTAFAQDVKAENSKEFDKFLEILEIYETDFFKEKSKEQILLDTIKKILENDPSSFEWVIDSFLKSGDQYSRYINEQEVYDLNNAKVYGGIGITVMLENGGTVIAEITSYSPAARAQMMIGDVLLSVNGHNVTSLALESISQLARGEVGTEVEYVVFRPSTGETLSFKMIRETISLETITYEVVTDAAEKYAICRINDFQGMSTYFEFVDFKEAMLEQDIKRIVFDVRNNPGGDLNIVLEIVNWLIPEKDKTIVTISPRDLGKSTVVKSTGRELKFDKIIILVDERTASAAELFAISLQDHKLATIVGEQTYGKAIGQNYYELEDGTIAAITTIQVASPSGKYYNEIGVIPDVKVKNSETPREIPAMKALTLNNFKLAQQGESNESILALEERLVYLGYMSKSDYEFDTATSDALKTYQKRAGLLQSGALDFEAFESISETVEILSKITIKNDDQLEKARELIVK